MALQFRRVVTGHDETGRAVVKIDEISQNLVSSRPGATAGVDETRFCDISSILKIGRAHV